MTPPLGTARDPREVELKFHLPQGSRAILEKYPALAEATAEHSHLVSTYFDTPDRALDRNGLTLRVRRNGEGRIQNVKSRSDGHGVAASRGEWEWPIGQDTPEVAWLAKTPTLAAAATAIKGRLQPAFTTNIRRTTRLVGADRDTATVRLGEDHRHGRDRNPRLADRVTHGQDIPLGALGRIALHRTLACAHAGNGETNSAEAPSSCSIARSRLYLAIRSLRQSEPVLIWPPPIPTEKSAMKASSVSPER